MCAWRAACLAFDGSAMGLLESGHFAGSAWELVARAAAPGLCLSGLCSCPYMRMQPAPPGPCRPHLLGLRKSLEWHQPAQQ